MYNLEVEQEHQFYVGESGVLVHNDVRRELRQLRLHEKMAWLAGATERRFTTLIKMRFMVVSRQFRETTGR